MLNEELSPLRVNIMPILNKLKEKNIWCDICHLR
jgi:hypothetical protein